MEQLLKFNNRQIRAITDEHEQTWFAGIDVCDILEYAMPSNVIKKTLDEDERKLTNLRDGSGQSRKTWIVNEAGLYRLIINSTKSETKPFKRWVFHEVLPSIRKAGKYTSEQAQEYEAGLQDVANEIESLKSEKDEYQSKVNNLRKDIEAKTTEMLRMIKTDRSQLRIDFNEK